MIPTAVIAALTVKEAVRRRFVFAGFLVCLAFLLIAVIQIHPRFMIVPAALLPQFIAAIISTNGCSMIAFFSGLFAIALGAGTISGEIERGVLAVIVPKPIRRVSIYLGKWLGINLFIAPFVFVWIAILQYAIHHHTGSTMPQLWRAFGILMLYPAVFSALTMLFSAVTSTLLATILPLILASAAWSEGILARFGYGFNIATLKTMSKVVVYLAPLNPLSRWVEKILQPTILEMIPRRDYFVPVDPPAGMRDLAWILAYGIVALVVGAVIFQRRDLGS